MGSPCPVGLGAVWVDDELAERSLGNTTPRSLAALVTSDRKRRMSAREVFRNHPLRRPFYSQSDETSTINPCIYIDLRPKGVLSDAAGRLSSIATSGIPKQCEISASPTSRGSTRGTPRLVASDNALQCLKRRRVIGFVGHFPDCFGMHNLTVRIEHEHASGKQF